MSPETCSNAARPLTPMDPACSEQPNGTGASEPRSPEQAYEAYFDLVWRNLRRLGLSNAAVEDATQDVFLVVHRRWTEFEGRSSLKTWVVGICLHVAKQYLRRGARAAREESELEEQHAVHLDTTRDLEQRQATRQLMMLLDHLNETHRTILVLVELEELTVAEAAQALNIPASTAYKRLQKAHRAFEQLWSRRTARDEWRFR
jgi:RNA polymerase sigma-70 factor (ECF subfamily)